MATSMKRETPKAPAKTTRKSVSAVGARSAQSRGKSGGKPPRGVRFGEGQKGNPGGRPRLPEELKVAAKALSMEALDTLATLMRSKKTPAAARVKAAEAILDRGWGKPTQPLAGEDGQPIQIATIIRRIVDGAPNAG